MGDCIKFCYTCDADTTRYCTICTMPVCEKCAIPNVARFEFFTDVCKRCDSHKIQHQQTRWCVICDVLTTCFASFAITHPIKYIPSSSRNGGFKPTCTSGVYLHVCNNCNNDYPSFYKLFKKIAIKNFTEEMATHMLTLVNDIRAHHKSQILDQLLNLSIHIPAELCKLVADYCNTRRHYEYLYVVRRYKDVSSTVYDFADDKMYENLERYKVEKKITN